MVRWHWTRSTRSTGRLTSHWKCTTRYKRRPEWMEPLARPSHHHRKRMGRSELFHRGGGWSMSFPVFPPSPSPFTSFTFFTLSFITFSTSVSFFFFFFNFLSLVAYFFYSVYSPLVFPPPLIPSPLCSSLFFFAFAISPLYFFGLSFTTPSLL